MRAALIAIMVLLLPAALFAGQTIGIWFDYRAGMTYSPMPHESFVGYVYADNANCYISGIEFALSPIPPTVYYDGYEVPEGALSIGDPIVGVGISYFPPLNGYYPGYNELCKLHFTAEEDWCYQYGGTLVNVPLQIIPHPETGFVRGTCYPENNFFDLTGLMSYLCPEGIGTKPASWGAIKSLF